MSRARSLCENAAGRPGREARISAVLTAFWEFLRPLSPNVKAALPLSDSLRRAERFMEDHLGERLNLGLIAAGCGLSKAQLNVLAREQWNLTPFERLWQMRLERASRMLRDTGLTVAEIAWSTGFSNPYHFSRRFAACFGAPPRAWRQSQWLS